MANLHQQQCGPESFAHNNGNEEATILLIGSTGMGKSTLGNYLLEKGFFEIGADNNPTTKVTGSGSNILSVEALASATMDLTVIDTPGLNEGNAEDLEHMIGIVEELEKKKEIAACIFVVKFNAKLDKQYIDTIEYYSKLLPSLFEKNAFVVMTNFATGPRADAIRKRQRLDVDTIINNAVEKIELTADLKYGKPIAFQIDCIPMEENEVSYSKKARNSIIKYIMQLQPVCLNDLFIAKTSHLLQIDKVRISECQGRIDGYVRKKGEVEELLIVILKEIKRRKSGTIAELYARIDSIERELKEKDTAELVTAAQWSVDTEEKFLQTQEKGCELESEWKIAKLRYWASDKCEWTDVEKTEHTFKGKIKGDFSYGSYANVVLETEKCIKYAAKICQLKEELKIAKSELESEEEGLQSFYKQYHAYKAEIEDLNQFIDEKLKEIRRLQIERMTIAEAKERLSKIQKKD